MAIKFFLRIIKIKIFDKVRSNNYFTCTLLLRKIDKCDKIDTQKYSILEIWSKKIGFSI